MDVMGTSLCLYSLCATKDSNMKIKVYVSNVTGSKLNFLTDLMFDIMTTGTNELSASSQLNLIIKLHQLA